MIHRSELYQRFFVSFSSCVSRLTVSRAEELANAGETGVRRRGAEETAETRPPKKGSLFEPSREATVPQAAFGGERKRSLIFPSPRRFRNTGTPP